jgi:hypothetical protein
MRRFAWLLVVAGVLVGIASPFYASRESERLVDRWYNDGMGSNDLARLQNLTEMLRQGLVPTWTQVSPWPGVVAGAALAGFGVLVLAIRRPEQKEGA